VISSQPLSTLTAPQRPWDRRATFALLALILVCVVSLAWLVHPWFDVSEDTNDAAIYVATARALLAGEGYAYLGEPFTVRPPGMSVLLAGLMAWRGADWWAANMAVSLSGVACVALLFVLARPRIGDALAWLAAIAAWFSDPFQRWCNQILSDVPGAALVLACVAVERWAARRPSVSRDVVLAACIGGSTYVRSAALLLVPAILLARALEQRRAPGPVGWWDFVRRRALPLVLVVLAITVPWSVRNALHHPVPPVEQTALYSYSTGMWHADWGDPNSARVSIGSVLERVPQRAGALLALFGSALHRDSGAASLAGGIAFVALAAVGTWRRRSSLELFAWIHVAVLLVYFAFKDRLALPLWIALLPAAIEGFVVVARPLLGARGATAAAGVLVLVMPIAGFRPRAGWERIEATHAFYTRFAADVRVATSATQRVAAPIGWHLAVFLERPVWSLVFAERRARGFTGIEAVIERRSIDAVLFAARSESERRLVPALVTRYGPAQPAGEAILVRTRP